MYTWKHNKSILDIGSRGVIENWDLVFNEDKYNDLISSTIFLDETHIDHKGEYRWRADVLYDAESFSVPLNVECFGWCKTLEEAQKEVIISVKLQLQECVQYFIGVLNRICYATIPAVDPLDPQSEIIKEGHTK